MRLVRGTWTHRIAAGVVGIAVFVAAIWVVTSVGPLDRSEPSVVPGGDVTGPAQTGPAETVHTDASTALDVMRRGRCSGTDRPISKWRLELRDVGDEISVKFLVHLVGGNAWRIVLRHGRAGPDPFDYGDGRVFFEGQEGPPPVFHFNIPVEQSVGDLEGDDGFAARAVDTRTGRVCKGRAVI